MRVLLIIRCAGTRNSFPRHLYIFHSYFFSHPIFLDWGLQDGQLPLQEPLPPQQLAVPLNRPRI